MSDWDKISVKWLDIPPVIMDKYGRKMSFYDSTQPNSHSLLLDDLNEGNEKTKNSDNQTMTLVYPTTTLPIPKLWKMFNVSRWRYNSPVQVLNMSQTLDKMRVMINEFAELLCVSEIEMEMLLRALRWNTIELQSLWTHTDTNTNTNSNTNTSLDIDNVFRVRDQLGIYPLVDLTCFLPGVGCVYQVVDDRNSLHQHQHQHQHQCNIVHTTTKPISISTVLSLYSSIFTNTNTNTNHPNTDWLIHFTRSLHSKLAKTLYQEVDESELVNILDSPDSDSDGDSGVGVGMSDNTCVSTLPPPFPTPYSAIPNSFYVAQSFMDTFTNTNSNTNTNTNSIINSHHSFSSPPLLYVQCSSAYCDIVPIKSAYSLACGHWFCHSCWAGHVKNEFDQGPSSLGMRCGGINNGRELAPFKHAHGIATGTSNTEIGVGAGVGKRCNLMVPLNTIISFLDSLDVNGVRNSVGRSIAPSSSDDSTGERYTEKMLRWAVDLFIECRSNARYCPNQKCVIDYKNTCFSDSMLTNTNITTNTNTNTNTKTKTNQLIHFLPSTSTTSKATRESRIITCVCGTSSCFHCGHEPHIPCPCDIYSHWTDLHSGDDATAIYIKSQTKPCPRCKVLIQKNMYCNHMRCMCSHEFCWLCLGDWSSHGTMTGGLYACNRYQSDEKKWSDVERQVRENTDRLHKLNYYMNHFQHHLDCMNNALKLREDIVEFIRDVSAYVLSVIDTQSLSHRSPPNSNNNPNTNSPNSFPLPNDHPSATTTSHSFCLSNFSSVTALQLNMAVLPPNVSSKVLNTEVDKLNGFSPASRDKLVKKFMFLLRAIDEVIDGRNIIRWTFVLSYFMRTTDSTNNGSTVKSRKQMFEMQQELYLNNLESLSQLISNLNIDITRTYAQKNEIHTLMTSLTQLKNMFISQMTSGEFEDSLMYSADADFSQDKWTCICGTTLTLSQGICSTCKACRVHGEVDCKVCKQF